MTSRRCGARRRTAGAQSPAFAERGAIADLDRDAEAVLIHLNPERVGSVVSDIVTVGILWGEHGSRFIRREHMAAHVALGIAMLFWAHQFVENLNPILHGLIIHLQDHMLNDRWSDAFVGEGKMNRPIAAVEFEDGPDRCAHLLALHVGGVTRNTQSQESDKGRNHCVISAGAARLPVFRHGADHIVCGLSVKQPSV
jgi:hypothetical protein